MFDFLKGFPKNARLWVYPSSKNLSAQELTDIQKDLAIFCTNWIAHGDALKATVSIVKNRFIIICTDEQIVQASGCSIDSSIKFIKELEQKYTIKLLDRMQVCYETNNAEVQSFNFNQLNDKIKDGTITPETIIYNNSVSSVADLENNWQKPLKESWLMPFSKNTLF
ncbi:MAG: ABC transporter ATPase [Bacteroidia bacterium]|nr:ABC transporter ATPase [Bacteroidia bacterium]